MTRRFDRTLALSTAGALAGTALISAIMVLGMYSPGTAATHRMVQGGLLGGSAGTSGIHGGTTGGAGGHATGGGGGGTVSGNGVPAGSLPSQGVGGGVIHLGSIVTQSGPGRSTSMADAIIAWEKTVNASGGINGYKIDVDGGTILDDQGNPDLGASEFRQLWQDDKVFAFVGECAPLTDEQMVSYIQSNDVPMVGECQTSANAYSPPSSGCYCVWVGGPTPTQNGQLGALLMEQAEHWPTSGGQIALVCLDDPTTQQDCSGAAQQYGSGALWNGGPQMEQIYDNNYSDLIAQWQSAGISHVHLVLDPGSVDRYLQAAQNAGYNPQVMNNLVIDDGI
ncbi:MAG TPA: ABC transporter substrate-binding protein, partial [Dehalococcoidia bacterium]|nr:ABC transporter substrate-binding protein [Dehalococcoidia bacterium]